MKTLSSFAHPHVVPNLFDLWHTVEYKIIYYKTCLHIAGKSDPNPIFQTYATVFCFLNNVNCKNNMESDFFDYALGFFRLCCCGEFKVNGIQNDVVWIALEIYYFNNCLNKNIIKNISF